VDVATPLLDREQADSGEARLGTIRCGTHFSIPDGSAMMRA